MKKRYTILVLFAILGLTTSQAQKRNIDSGLVAYYPFNGNANDESGNSHNGTVNGATLVSDRFGIQNAAYYFNGISDLIEIMNSDSLNLQPGGITLAGWASFSDNNDNTMIFGKHLYTFGTGYGLGFVYNQAEFYLDGPNSELRTFQSYQDGKWHCVVGRYEGSTISIYIDGMLTKAQWNIYDRPNTVNITIGASNMYGGGYNGWFNGKIDDIRIYNRALSETEILQLYNEGGWVGIPGYSGLEDHIELFPNPATDKVYLKSNKLVQINVYNVLGEQIFTGSSKDGNCVSLTQKGIYVFELISEKNRELRKIIVQ